MTNAIKHVVSKLHVLESLEYDVKIFIRPKFPRADKRQLNHVRTLLPAYLNKKLDDYEASFEDVLECCKPRTLLDPVFDKIDLHLSRDSLVKEMLDAICCFLPLEDDPDNLNRRVVVTNHDAANAGVMEQDADALPQVVKKKDPTIGGHKDDDRTKQGAAAGDGKNKSAAMSSTPGGGAQKNASKAPGAKGKAKAKSKAGASSGNKTSPGNKAKSASPGAKSNKSHSSLSPSKKNETAAPGVDDEDGEDNYSSDNKLTEEELLDIELAKPNRCHEASKLQEDYNQVIQSRILPLWRSTQDGTVILQLCKVCSLMHTIDNKILVSYLLGCPKSSYAWLALGKSAHYSEEALTRACEVLAKGTNLKPSLDRAVAFFVARHLLTVCERKDTWGDMQSLLTLDLAKNLCQSLILALSKKMKRLYDIADNNIFKRSTGKHNSERPLLWAAAAASKAAKRNKNKLSPGGAGPDADARSLFIAMTEEDKFESATIQTYCCAFFLLLRHSVFEDWKDLEMPRDVVWEV